MIFKVEFLRIPEQDVKAKKKAKHTCKTGTRLHMLQLTSNFEVDNRDHIMYEERGLATKVAQTLQDLRNKGEKIKNFFL